MEKIRPQIEQVKVDPLPLNGDVFIAPDIPSHIKPNRIRQNKNLHGEKGVSGLTGYWHDRYYHQGVAQPRSPNKQTRKR